MAHEFLPRQSFADYQAQHFAWRASASGKVGIITLNRPEKKNPLTFQSYTELRNLFRGLRDADDIKVLVITGAGGNFCSGGDVHEIIGPLTQMSMPELLDFTHLTGDVVKAMRACPQPIIAAVDGICVGAGAILAMAADFRYGTPNTRTAFLFTKVGLAGCDMGACAILPRIIGQGRASELLFTGRTMRADEGLQWGFYNALYDSEVVLEKSLEMAESLAAGPTFAHGITKTMLHQEWAMGVDEAIEAEAEAQAICMQTNDFRRAYEAFVNKETPVFEGD